MNISAFHSEMQSGNRSGNTIYAGNMTLLNPAGFKSTKEKEERQQKTAGQIEFWENQKANLKFMECNTVEEIAEKLEQFHTYENEITAAKMAYNNEQMWHTLDEARELGEKIAKAAEKYKPKTEEERKEEQIEEALGIDENESILEESMEEMAEVVEESLEAVAEEQLEEIEESTEELSEKLPEENFEQDKTLTEQQLEEMQTLSAQKAEQEIKRYRHFDMFV